MLKSTSFVVHKVDSSPPTTATYNSPFDRSPRGHRRALERDAPC